MLTSTPAIDLITFSPTAAQLGTGTAIAGTGGDLSGGVETAAIVSNSGNVTLNATATGALCDGAGDSINFSQITTTGLDAHLRDGVAGAGVDERGERQCRAHRARDEGHYAGREVDVRIREQRGGADRYVRRREHQQQPSGVHRHDAVTLLEGRRLQMRAISPSSPTSALALTSARGSGVLRILRQRALVGALLSALAATQAAGFTATLNPAAPLTVYLQVGVGSFTNDYIYGGQPQNNATINTVSVSVASTVLGNATAQAMTTNSTAAQSYWDGYTYCSVPGQLYIGGFYRTTGGSSAAAQVTATVPAGLTDGAGDTLPFSKIQWTSSGNGDTRRGALSSRHVRQRGRAEPSAPWRATLGTRAAGRSSI